VRRGYATIERFRFKSPRIQRDMFSNSVTDVTRFVVIPSVPFVSFVSSVPNELSERSRVTSLV